MRFWQKYIFREMFAKNYAITPPPFEVRLGLPVKHISTFPRKVSLKKLAGCKIGLLRIFFVLRIKSNVIVQYNSLIFGRSHLYAAITNLRSNEGKL